jgi:hypothetical protein
MHINSYCLLIFLPVLPLFSYSQMPDSLLKISSNLPGSYYSSVDKKITSINDRLTKTSMKYLSRFHRQEAKLQQKIKNLNPVAPATLFTGANENYRKLETEIKTKFRTDIKPGGYNPYLDSLAASLSFLKQINSCSDKIKKPLASLHELEGNIEASEKIKQFIDARKEVIKQILSEYAAIPVSLKKQYDKLNKTAYYYLAQVKAYKEMLNDPKKIEQQALTVLNKLPAFQKFIRQNGQLSSLFSINENIDAAESLTGLQRRSSVQLLLQQRMASGGTGASQIIQQNIATAKSELTTLKDKVALLGGGNSDLVMPEFKVNDQKTKSFFKRLEYSTDIQFPKNVRPLPAVAEIGLGIGYKLNDKNVIGFGVSYKMGIGSMQHIRITNEGIGFRSYVSYKIKGSLFMTGGYEMNYNTTFKKFDQFKNYGPWQKSALAGLTKKYIISKKIKGEMKVLYDFLSNAHIPVTQALVCRIGYGF